MRKTTILLLGLSVAACSVGPEFERPELYRNQDKQKSTMYKHRMLRIKKMVRAQGVRKKNNRCSGCFSTNGEGLSACERKNLRETSATNRVTEAS